MMRPDASRRAAAGPAEIVGGEAAPAGEIRGPARIAVAASLLLVLPAVLTGVAGAEAERSGRELYLAACANCHGTDGRGAPQSRVAFEVPLPDFSDCDFANREPDTDWVAVSHGGGPMRGFSELMPAFGDALGVDEIERAVAYLRTFCGDPAWPRGELNLPRPLVTGKAYPEDEAVFAATVATEGPGSVATEVIYEQRFGARNQWEIAVPVAWRETDPAGDAGWSSGVGDVAVGLKRAVWHSYQAGSIVSVAAELLLPTGDEARGFGSGTTIFEPFVAWGQLLPSQFFLQAHAGLELPFRGEKADDEAFARLALGRSFSEGRWGRTWSPMVEVLAARELTAGGDLSWDLVPQLQVTLNARQNIMANIGLRIPVNDTDSRHTAALVYLLWDWFDGGITEGW